MFRSTGLKALSFFEKEKPKFICFSSVSHLIKVQEHELGRKTNEMHQHWGTRGPEKHCEETHVCWYDQNNIFWSLVLVLPSIYLEKGGGRVVSPSWSLSHPMWALLVPPQHCSAFLWPVWPELPSVSGHPGSLFFLLPSPRTTSIYHVRKGLCRWFQIRFKKEEAGICLFE